jgi:hypothetical protein
MYIHTLCEKELMTGRSSLKNVLCLALEVGRRLCSNGIFVFTFQQERLVMRNWWKMCFGLSAVAIIVMAATTASAAPGGLLVNSDIELVSRFLDWGAPGAGQPNGVPDGWHGSSKAEWSGPPEGGIMAVSGVHSLYLPDAKVSDHEEFRSFATAIPGGHTSLDLSWKWKWEKTAGDVFSATVRISKAPVGGLDLGGAITDHLVLTDGSALSGGGTGDWEMYMTSIPLAADDASFDVIFRTRDNAGDSSELGSMWVDDVCAVVPEPATMGLLGLAGLGLMMVSRRRRG